MSSTQRHIIVLGAGWIQNMGNAFIQLGSKYAVQQAVPGAHVHIVDGNDLPVPLSPTVSFLNKMGDIPLLRFLKQPEKNRYRAVQTHQLRLAEIAQADAIVFSGVWLTKKYLDAYKKFFSSLKNRGVTIIFNGCGGTHYNDQEYSDVATILDEIKPYAIITRDDKAYAAYKNVSSRVFSGIDVGFFSADAVPHPLPLIQKPTVLCFDRGPLPARFTVDENTILTHHSVPGLRFNTFAEGKTFYSEVPEDYLHLYANADTVYSDRVHACVATLSFGNKAQLVDTTPRAFLFEAVGAGGIRENPVRADMALLARKKAEHISTLASVFAELWKA